MEHYQVNKTAVLLLVLALVGRGAGFATAQEPQQRRGATSQPTKQAKTLSAPDEARATAMTESLKDKDAPVREAAISSLLTIDPENKAVAKAVPEKARVQGKYSKLLWRIHVPQDKQSYSEFKEYGHYQATDYAGHTNLPAGHWVYVYPHWYIWGEMKQGK